jgi:hypothetical protein
MSEERQVHPQEPAEGSEQEAGAPGADRAGGEKRVAEGANDEARSHAHPQEPAEGAEEDVRAAGTERAEDSG